MGERSSRREPQAVQRLGSTPVSFWIRSAVESFCIHDKHDGNPHAHVMLTMRPFTQDGSWAAKSRKEYILHENGQCIVLPSRAYKTRKVDATDWNDQGWAEKSMPHWNRTATPSA